jgi:HEAT repeat protein
MFGFIKKIFGMDAERTPISTVFTELNTLGRKQLVMPVEIFRLSTALAESPEREIVVASLLKDYVAHSSAHVRRATVIAFRKMEDYRSAEVTEAIFQRLSDENPWVVYDAAWYFQNTKPSEPKILAKLKTIAGDAVELSNEELEIPFDLISDANLQAKHQAAKAVQAMI